MDSESTGSRLFPDHRSGLAVDPKGTVLVIAAGRLHAEEQRQQLLHHGFSVEIARSMADALERLTARAYDALLVHWRTLEVEYLGREWRPAWQRCVRTGRQANAHLVLVVDVDAGVRLPEEVAQFADWIEVGPIDAARLGRAIPREAARTRATDWLVGASLAAQSLSGLVESVASRDGPVLITGENGTGKSYLASVIHRLSRQSDGRLLTIRCHGLETVKLPPEFAGEGGGTKRSGPAGRPNRAPAGAVLLDAVEDLSLDAQARLVRLLDGEEAPGWRWMAASSADLHARAAEGRFLEPLLYRLAVYPVPLQPLRERAEDIPALLEHFAGRVAKRDHVERPVVPPDVARALMRRPWWGNLRELENAVEYAMVRRGGQRELGLDDFPPERPAGSAVHAGTLVPLGKGQNLKAAVARFERTLIEEALHQAGGNRVHAARLLGVKRTTLIEKLKRWEGAR